MMRKNRFLNKLFYMTTLVFIVCISLLASSSLGAKIPVIYLNTQNKSDTEVGLNLYYAIKKKIPDFEILADRHLAESTSQTTFDYVLLPRAEKIFENIPENYKNRLKALQAVLDDEDIIGDDKLSYNEAIVSNLTGDIGRSTNCSSFGVFNNYSNLNSPIVGRNFDWGSNEHLRALQAITVLEDASRIGVSIGFAGIASVTNGFNSNGLFVAIHDSPMANAYPGADGKRSYVFDLTHVLETCSSIEEAKDFLYNKPYTYSYNILLADENNIQILEHPQGENGQLRSYDSTLRPELTWGKSNQIGVVNCFALQDSPANNVSYFFSSTRWNRLMDLAVFDSDNPASMDDVESIMLDTANSPSSIFNSITMQSMVFSTIDRHLRLYTIPISGSHPADPEMTDYPSLLKLNPNKMLMWDSKLVVDFGEERGLYSFDGNDWSKLSGWGNVAGMIIWNDRLVIDFGQDRGLHYYDTQWHELSGWDTTANMLTWDDGSNTHLVVDFGNDRGLYYHDSSNWQKISDWDDAGKIIVWDNKLVIDYDSGRGLYSYGPGPNFEKLAEWDSVSNMMPWNDGTSEFLAVDFGLNRGIYTFHEGSWSKLAAWDSSSHMMTWDNKLVVDFAQDRGIYYFDTQWHQLSGWDNCADIQEWDSGASNNLVVDFGQERGLYFYNTTQHWQKLAGWDDVHKIIPWGDKLTIDFGNSRGLYTLDGSIWNKLSGWDDTSQIINNGNDIVVDFGCGRGVHSYDTKWEALSTWSIAD